MKKIFSVTILMLLIFVANVEAAKSSPADDINTLCKAVLQGDEISLQKIGLTPEFYEQSIIENFTKSFTDVGGINFSESQLERIKDGERSLFKHSQFTTETVSQKDNNATVKVSMGRFEKITEQNFIANAPANFDKLSDAEKVDAFATVIATTLQNLQIADTVNFEVKCNYNESAEMWLPDESEKFGEMLVGNLFNFDK